MKKFMLEFYGLAVCFGSVICFVICSGVAGYKLVQVVKPDFTMNSGDFYSFQSNDAFWKNCNGNYGDYRSCGSGPYVENKPRPSEEELTKERVAAYGVALAKEQRRGMQTLVEMLIIMSITAVAFFSHWVIAKRARTLAAAWSVVQTRWGGDGRGRGNKRGVLCQPTCQPTGFFLLTILMPPSPLACSMLLHPSG